MSVAPAKNALTSIDRCRAAGYGLTATEVALQMSINAVSAAFERICNRVFAATTYVDNPNVAIGQRSPEWVAGSGGLYLCLNSYPIQAVSKVVVGGSEISDWYLDAELAGWGALYRPAGWPRSEGRFGHLTGDPDGLARRNILVSYSGGFSEIPADIELCAMRECEMLVAGDASKSVRSERTPGGWSVSYAGADRAFSLETQMILNDYKRHTF